MFTPSIWMSHHGMLNGLNIVEGRIVDRQYDDILINSFINISSKPVLAQGFSDPLDSLGDLLAGNPCLEILLDAVKRTTCVKDCPPVGDCVHLLHELDPLIGWAFNSISYVWKSLEGTLLETQGCPLKSHHLAVAPWVMLEPWSPVLYHLRIIMISTLGQAWWVYHRLLQSHAVYHVWHGEVGYLAGCSGNIILETCHHQGDSSAEGGLESPGGQVEDVRYIRSYAQPMVKPWGFTAKDCF